MKRDTPLPAWENAALLRATVAALAWALRVGSLVDARVRKGLVGFEAIYELRSGAAVRRLCLSGGHVRTGPSTARPPDYRIDFIDLPGTLRLLAEDPDDVLRLLVENRIAQRGNTYYLFRLGYLVALCQARWVAVAARLARRRPEPTRSDVV